ncbi:MAG: 4-(cytidine 5'-diphospho)-2-C-methyl-D-erythritol kinase [Dehalococcoidales bacterium]|nr:4-(cytidine 5'-diphospho)-2-C-methyl-D-erythritol kinase [Dehalococcoidales bacterium]
MITLKAPAKINLTLEVLRKQPDGFHEIRSILQTIDLHDTLYIQKSEGISYRCDMEGWSVEKSLVNKAVALLREETGYQGGVEIRIEKRIPLMSGLGGDSSDAGALLRGLNELWGLSLGDEKLAELAAKLGSDAPFFMHGGTALAARRGEKITPLPSVTGMWLVLVIPDIPVEKGKTGRMYASLKPSHFTDGGITDKVVEALRQGKPFKTAMLFNTFENIAFADFNIKRVYVDHLIKMGALHVHLAGSGPALFTMFTDKARAGDIYSKCQKQGMKAFLAQTL